MQKRMQKKPYFPEIASRPGVLWFRAKAYGWGWVPITWQGWSIVAMYVFLLFFQAISFERSAMPESAAAMHFILFAYILTVFLIIICYATGETPGWRWGGSSREKDFDILDAQGNMTGERASRSVVHDQGLWHRAVHVYVVNSRNEVLLQCRSSKNSLRPGRWYLSFGGHLEAGEDSLAAARRLARDEFGLDLDEREFLPAGTIRKENVLLYGTYVNNEFDDIYVVQKDVDDLHIAARAKEEITRIAWFPIDEYRQYIHGNDPDFVQYDGVRVFFEWVDKNAE